MEAQYEEISEWKPWCLENTLSLLQQKFPDSCIWVIRPVRMLRSLFSCFHNFVQSSIVGIPTYSCGYGALPQIEALLQDIISQVHSKGQLRLPLRIALELPLVLVGFSKGCVVLNQLVHELVNVSMERSHTPSFHHSSNSSLHHSSTSSLHHSHTVPHTLQLSHHRKTPSVSSVSSLSSMEDGAFHTKPNLQSPSILNSPSLSQAHSNPSIHRHPSVSSLTSEPGVDRELAATQHRSRSRSPMLFSRSGSSSSTSQGKRVILLSEEDITKLRLLLGRLRAMYWLDAGHSGGYGAWVTDEDLLRCLAGLGTGIHVHVTPQQIADTNRSWIKEEERMFVDKLRLYGADVTEVLHFEHEERSLRRHFQVLNEF